MSMKNKVYLLYPPISKRERYSSEIGSAGGQQIPLGIYYLASYLLKHGFDVKVTDAEVLGLSSAQIVNEIGKYGPDFVGISSTTVAFHRAVEVATAIKERMKDACVILGGPHVTANPEQAMQFGQFDYGVLREGEVTFIELLKAIIASTDASVVKGIVYRTKEGTVHLTPPREYIQDLDSLPFPAFHLITDIGLYNPPPSNYRTLPVISMITSRGCPNQCTFCDNNVFGRKYRQRSAENIVEEIKILWRKYHFREIAFVDDTFLIDKERIYKLFRLLEGEGISFFWTCMSWINNIDYEFLKFIQSKGCWHISFGIESGDEAILKLIRKNISLDKAIEVVDWCHQLKIRTKGFFIMGHPVETIRTLDKTIQMACRLKLDDIVVTINTPIPGSLQYAEAAKYGTLDTTDWAQFNYWRPVFIPHGLTREILLRKHREFYRRFYLRPHVLFRYFLSFFSKGGMQRFLSILKASLFLVNKC